MKRERVNPIEDNNNKMQKTTSMETLQNNLYKNAKIKQTLSECLEVALEKGPALQPTDFERFDSMHYLGAKSLLEFCDTLPIDSKWKCVDVGAGYGSTSRMLAWKYSCKVHAIEYQPDVLKAGFVLNRLQGLSQLVTFVGLDITTLGAPNLNQQPSSSASHPPANTTTERPITSNQDQDSKQNLELEILSKYDLLDHDLLVSQLVFLHVEDKTKCFNNISKLLKPKGLFYIEDYYIFDNVQLTNDERNICELDIAIPKGKISTKTEYEKLLNDSGMEIMEWRDMTDLWTDFVWSRFDRFLHQVEDLEIKQ